MATASINEINTQYKLRDNDNISLNPRGASGEVGGIPQNPNTAALQMRLDKFKGPMQSDKVPTDSAVWEDFLSGGTGVIALATPGGGTAITGKIKLDQVSAKCNR